jgi:hypothetical protein
MHSVSCLNACNVSVQPRGKHTNSRHYQVEPNLYDFQARSTNIKTQINKLAVVLGGETAKKFPKLTIPSFGRLLHEREKKLRDPQDVLIEADRLRKQLKKRRAQRRGTQQQ